MTRIEIKIDSAAAQRRVDAMVENVAALQDKVPAELEAWQREDMNRRYPNITRIDAMTSMTQIWPRSRLAPRPRQNLRRRIAVRLGGQRPILRAELFERLRERMRALLEVLPKKWG